MTIVNGYATAEQFIARYLTSTVTATSDNYPQIEQHISAASRLIDDYTGRTFYTATADADRYFTPQARCRCYIDDYQTITTVAVDEDEDGSYALTLSATGDYWTRPANPQNGWPYTWIEIMPWSNNPLPAGQPYAVKITALWGWAAVPDAVREACLLQAFKIYKRQGAPFGVVGGGELGTVVAIPSDDYTRLDRDVAGMLKPYMRIVP